MNSYFWDFDMKCPLFHNDPNTIAQFKRYTLRSSLSSLSPSLSLSLTLSLRDGVVCGRLPAYYNGDIGPYYLHDASWLLPEQRAAPKLLHFTLGVFKPWQWWWYPVFDICWLWYDLYSSIPNVNASLPSQVLSTHHTHALSLSLTFSLSLSLSLSLFLSLSLSSFSLSFFFSFSFSLSHTHTLSYALLVGACSGVPVAAPVGCVFPSLSHRPPSPLPGHSTDRSERSRNTFGHDWFVISRLFGFPSLI
jgi:hypothetical protein